MPDVRPPDADALRRVVEAALAEDGAQDDVTTRALVPPGQRGAGAFISKDTGVLCGLPAVEAVFAALDGSVRVEACMAEGASLTPGAVIARINGPLAAVLSGERVALNLLQRLSGIATATRQLVDAVAGVDVRIVDTRKTTPGLRELERYAVRAGGGGNHRFNLTDAVLIKDNHLAAVRARGLGIADAVREARRAAAGGMRIEVEVTTPEEAREALDAGADAILLDNMPLEDVRRVVATAKGRVELEASGGITIKNVRAVAETGVDVISVGAVTHSARALDISLELEPA
jgi:nicotinate-nucleotide pyrophosphorylase (carboxylating)